MKVQRLILGTLLSLYCSVSHAEEHPKAICDKGIFPNTAPSKESVIPLTEENDQDDSDTTTQPSDTQQNEDQSSQSPSDQNQKDQKQTPSSNNQTKNCGGK